MSRCDGRTRQDHILYLGTQTQQAKWIIRRIDFISQTQIGQMIDIDSISQCDRNGILSQFHLQNSLSKGQFPNFFGQFYRC